MLLILKHKAVTSLNISQSPLSLPSPTFSSTPLSLSLFLILSLHFPSLRACVSFPFPLLLSPTTLQYLMPPQYHPSNVIFHEITFNTSLHFVALDPLKHVHSLPYVFKNYFSEDKCVVKKNIKHIK